MILDIGYRVIGCIKWVSRDFMQCLDTKKLQEKSILDILLLIKID